MLWGCVSCLFHQGISGAASIDGANQGKYLYYLVYEFKHRTYINIEKSTLLDGEFVSIFEKLNGDDEREMKEGVLAQSMPPLLANGNDSILNLLVTLAKIVELSKIKQSTIKSKTEVVLVLGDPTTGIFLTSHHKFLFIAGSKKNTITNEKDWRSRSDLLYDTLHLSCILSPFDYNGSQPRFLYCIPSPPLIFASPIFLCTHYHNWSLPTNAIRTLSLVIATCYQHWFCLLMILYPVCFVLFFCPRNFISRELSRILWGCAQHPMASGIFLLSKQPVDRVVPVQHMLR